MAGNFEQRLQPGHLLLQVNHFGLALRERRRGHSRVGINLAQRSERWDQDLRYPSLELGTVATPGYRFEDDIWKRPKLWIPKSLFPSNLSFPKR